MPAPESTRDSNTCTPTIPKRGEKLACVESVQERVIRVRCVTAEQRAEIRKLGGTSLLPFGSKWRLCHANEHELGALLAKLRDLGFLMAGASSGWPPAEVFRSLREKGLITGAFRELLYKGPAERMIYEETYSPRHRTSHPLSLAVLRKLNDAGWKPSRDEESIEREFVRILGSKWVPAASKFVRWFGNLSVAHTLWTWDGPVTEGFLLKHWDKITSTVGSAAVPVAFSGYMGDGALLWIDEHERYYIVDSEGMVYVGDNISTALDVLLLGEKPPAPPEHLKEPLARAYEWEKIPEG